MKYDVFISYAIEDKHPVASGIAARLRHSGLTVYFVGEQLDSGDLISETINAGLEQSRFSVLILSNYYKRQWPAIERNHILYRERKAGKKLVFPVWNNITKEEVSSSFPELADHYALSMERGLDSVADHLVKAIRKRKREDAVSMWVKALVIAGLMLCASFAIMQLTENTKGDPPVIHNSNPVQPDN